MKKLNNIPELKALRKKLRNNLTPAEAKLWTLLQKRQVEGRKFRRQHSIGKFILDFYCPSEKLTIELDGAGHLNANQNNYDFERTEFLNEIGVKVLRFENKDVFQQTERVLQSIRSEFGRNEK
jgi:very-short-patch-repair endonuclease